MIEASGLRKTYQVRRRRKTTTVEWCAGSVCDYVSQAGEGHTTDLRPGGAWWSSQLGPFIGQRLLS